MTESREDKSQDSSGGEQREFNKEDIGRLRSFLDSLEKSTGTCSLANSGKLHSLYALKASSLDFSNSWVTNFGAIDHMTHSSHKFLTYHPCPSKQKVSIFDGSLATIANQGDIILSPSITLKNVLHVPKLSINLVSIHQLIIDLNCIMVFSLISCIFRDQVTKRVIGHAKVRQGLYYLKLPNSQVNDGNRQPSSCYVSILF
ncbi:hypothetical protein Pint_04212 [Pistacia integerrima]|uniref:Uncharacterized protein n=1 Tax=Pistacia integerrima TaxID=434235 RepID=A0ACC0Z2T6_9ROSI|nr:hypothetical protein Pint_04212 [Pistacia integerrima]